MKKILFAALVPVFVLVAFKVNIDPLPIGASLPKPDVKMEDVSGNMVSLSEAKKENGLLVMFSCNTCPVVIKNQSRTIEASKHALANNVGVVLLNSNEGTRNGGDSFDEMKKYAKNQGYEWNYVVDKNHELADAFGANRTPEVFLFDKNGTLVYHGAIDDNPQDESAVTRNYLKEAVNELAEGKEITVKESKSIGCTIKRKK